MLFFLEKHADISKNKRVLVLKGIFSETTYVFVLTYQISSFWHSPNEIAAPPSPPLPLTLKRTPKKSA